MKKTGNDDSTVQLEHATQWEPLEVRIPKDMLRSEVMAWAAHIGVDPREVHIRPMRRKWGSCSTTGRISFSADLLYQPAAFRREVIVEELLHLRIPNHGKLFRSLKRAFLAQHVLPE